MIPYLFHYTKKTCCGKATLLESLLDTNPEHPYHGRYKVRFDCCTVATAHVQPQRLTPIYSLQGQTKQVLLCANTKEYRRLAKTQPQKTDFVIEIGSSFGIATDIIHQRARHVVGIDISKQLIEKAQITYPDIPFLCFDVLQDKVRLLSIAKDPSSTLWKDSELPYLSDMVFLDIGGNRELETVASILKFLQEELSPRLIVVKSTQLFKHAQSFYASLMDKSENEEMFLENELWWASLDGLIRDSNQKLMGLYPLKYPAKSTGQGLLICRYHNYTECKKGNSCPFDHNHCNTCGEEGHLSKNCHKFLSSNRPNVLDH